MRTTDLENPADPDILAIIDKTIVNARNWKNLTNHEDYPTLTLATGRRHVAADTVIPVIPVFCHQELSRSLGSPATVTGMAVLHL
jgi:hypothetical protein